jgi:hypothetical protein
MTLRAVAVLIAALALLPPSLARARGLQYPVLAARVSA